MNCLAGYLVISFGQILMIALALLIGEQIAAAIGHALGRRAKAWLRSRRT